MRKDCRNAGDAAVGRPGCRIFSQEYLCYIARLSARPSSVALQLKDFSDCSAYGAALHCEQLSGILVVHSVFDERSTVEGDRRCTYTVMCGRSEIRVGSSESRDQPSET